MPPTSLFFVLGLLPGAIEPLTLTSVDWTPAQPAAALAALRPVAKRVESLDRLPGSVLVIRHAGGDAGRDRATQLRSALVALGVPSSRLRLEPAAAEPDRLILEIDQNGRREQ